MTDIRTLTAALFEGDAKTLLSLCTKELVVQDQRLGRLEGRVAVESWVRNTASWLLGLQARSSEVSVLEANVRCVHELSLDIVVDGTVVDLPFVLVADRSEGEFTELRTYHSTWPYTGQHTFRAPPLEGRTPEPVPEVFATYIEQVSGADVAAILAAFTEDGYVREPSGDRWKHQGPQERETFYSHLVHAPRATFELASCTTDASGIAVEYAFSYGDTPMVGGICIMEVDGDKIAAVRITDDVGV